MFKFKSLVITFRLKYLFQDTNQRIENIVIVIVIWDRTCVQRLFLFYFAFQYDSFSFKSSLLQ